MTAEEFARREYDDNSPIDEFAERQADMKHAIWMMQQFAKFHVQAALKAASENPRIIIVTPKKDKYEPWGVSEVNKEAIINSYPLDNIK